MDTKTINFFVSVAFFVAAMLQLPGEERAALLARGLIVEEVAAWRQLAAGTFPLVLIPTFDEWISTSVIVLVPLAAPFQFRMAAPPTTVTPVSFIVVDGETSP